MDQTREEIAARHARIFDLLRAEKLDPRPGERAAAAARHYLDDRTAHRMIDEAVASLRRPAPPTVRERRAVSLSDLFGNRSSR
ncbi:hypothetical protein AB2B41_20940 [Marimonas sp. MJW-29]|uniref:Uncharacterized protein n=1 Tax=Sulfitobacter sediminis TaxID=3234186 RepID=A0ABV3RSZ5_9RHOB